ncbi:MAG TPA: fibronectin type III domain-containing protein, partial [Labilithrix sp.]|nr:fibronectin type III domain-containing protein [Labilithrix sp.]
MIAPRMFVFGLAIALGAGISLVACADGGPPDVASDAGGDVPFIEAGNREIDSADAHSVQVEPDAHVVLPDTVPPARVEDLVATADTHAEVTLTWTAPANEADAGAVAAYELRHATTPITTAAEFMNAAIAIPPAPLPSGSTQTVTVAGLLPATQYHFALRARDGAGNVASLSNDATVTTKPRAAFLVSEIAPVNTLAQGGDFVELVAVAAGSTADIEVRHSSGGSASALLYKLARLTVVVGDRVVVHALGLPAPGGFVQEDVSKDKTSSAEQFASVDAYDVYSAVDNLLGTTSVISVVDGAVYQDAVPYSDRTNVDASSSAMTALANAHAAGAWTFSASPVDGANDCPTLLEVVNANASSSAPACGGYPGFLAAGLSLQRNGVIDT